MACQYRSLDCVFSNFLCGIKHTDHFTHFCWYLHAWANSEQNPSLAQMLIVWSVYGCLISRICSSKYFLNPKGQEKLSDDMCSQGLFLRKHFLTGSFFICCSLIKIYQIESATKISSFGKSLFKLNGNGRKLLTFQYFLLFIFLKCIDDKL